MGRSKIEYCDNTWNPITGCMYAAECPQCREKRIARNFAGDIHLNKLQNDQFYKEGSVYVLDKEFQGERGILTYPFSFEPTLHLYRLRKMRYKTGCKILVGSMGEMFGEWIKDDWLEQIFEFCMSLPQHIYMFRTERPERYDNLLAAGRLPEGKNIWYGFRAGKGTRLPVTCRYRNTFMVIDDIQNPIEAAPVAEDIKWLILGDEVRRKKNPNADSRWIRQLVNIYTEKGVPVFMMDSMLPIVGETTMRREYPKQMEQYLHLHKYDGKRRKIMIGSCAICKKENRKSDMYSITAGGQVRGVYKTVGYVCRDCAAQIENRYGIEFSKIDEVEGRRGKHSE